VSLKVKVRDYNSIYSLKSSNILDLIFSVWKEVSLVKPENEGKVASDNLLLCSI